MMSSSQSVPPWTDNSARGGAESRPWLALWRRRQLVGYLALRDLKLRYRQAALGVIWVLVQPIASVVVFTFVFQRLAHITTQGVPYPLFALTGMITWTYFSTSLTRASDVLVGNPNLVTKVYFPRMAAPAAGLVSPLLDLAVSMTLLGALFGYYRFTPGLAVIALPAWLGLLACTTFGFSLWLSALNVRYRDIQHATAPALQIWLFASPVAYPGTLLSGWKALLYAINPVVGVINLGRWCVAGGPWPGWPLLVSVVCAGAVLLGGVRYFRAAERSFADVI